MTSDKVSPISIVAMRAEEYSDDGASIIISFKTKHSANERDIPCLLNAFAICSGTFKGSSCTSKNKFQMQGMRTSEY